MHAGEPTTDIAHKRDAVRMCGLAIAEQQLPNVHDKPASEWLNWLSTQEQTTLATNALLVRDSKQKLVAAQANDRAKPGKKARRLEQYKQAEANHNNATESATFALISALGELHTDTVVVSSSTLELGLDLDPIKSANAGPNGHLFHVQTSTSGGVKRTGCPSIGMVHTSTRQQLATDSHTP